MNVDDADHALETSASTAELPSLHELQRVRLAKAEALRSRGIDPYPIRSNRTHLAIKVGAMLADLETEDGEPDNLPELTLGGRVSSYRHMGKTIFAHLRDGSGEVQLYVRRDALGDEAFEDFLRLVDVGDILQASGTVFRTRTGEPSLRVSSFSLLAKSLNAPPEKWHGLQDKELRYRQRYADLIANEDVRNVFVLRARTVTAIRAFLDGLDYLEVETPALQPLYGGAAARPFTTHHNALDQTFYLRIADELYLKRLVVGGFERVYEICKDFRNEGVDRTHSPEFTMLEFYEAFADYTTMMDRLEGMIPAAAMAGMGSTTFTNNGNEIDLTTPWKRITLRDAIREFSGIDYVEHPTAAELTSSRAASRCRYRTGYRLAEHCRRTPEAVCPPKSHPADFPGRIPGRTLAAGQTDNLTDPNHVERFQLYIGGAELANSFTELNDPVDQWQRFMAQQVDREAGDEDAMPVDDDFINALMYGMPPTGGVGLGIDRLVMLFADQASIRDVVLFPAMRRLAPADETDSPEPPVED